MRLQGKVINPGDPDWTPHPNFVPPPGWQMPPGWKYEPHIGWLRVPVDAQPKE
jgi:hypothetical protein